MGKLHVGCDNLRALQQSFQQPMYKRSPKQKHSDLLSSISGVLNLNKLQVTYEHVEAHQDSSLPYDELSRLAQMNVRMDWLAKTASQLVQDNILPVPDKYKHPLSFAQVSVDNINIPHQISDLLYENLSRNILDQWWLTKGRYHINDIPTIHWEVCKQGAANHSKSDQRFASKWTSGFLATGSKMRQWNFRAGDACPFCLHPQETTQHVLHCPHPQSILPWNENLSIFLQKLQKLDTDPELC